MDESIRVLHVDDEPGFAELTAEFLEEADERIEVLTASRASEGLERLGEERVDCVVSDFEMPGMDGIEFLEAVREEYPALPFILFTGRGSEEVASDAISAGATDYLQKEGGTDQYTILANRVLNYADTAAAKSQRERQLDAIEAAQEGISILDEDGEFTYVNEAYADLYGYDSEKMLGMHWSALYPEDELSFAREEILSTAEEEGGWHGSSTGVRADGSTFVEDHTVSTTERGELVCTVRDVTERKERGRALAALHEAATDLEAAETEDEVYDVLLEAAEGILDFDLVAVDVVADDALVQTAWTLDLDTEGYYEETPLDEDTLATRSYHRQETIVVDDLSGHEVTPADPEYRSVLTVPMDELGTFQAVSRATGAFDEADRELTELLVGHAREALTRLERERELRQRTEALERQNDRLEEFATIVSHDLRSPLSVAEGRLELVRERYDDPHLDELSSALDRMSTLITDTLTLARQGQLVTAPDTLSIAEVASRCWGRAPTADATLDVEDATVRADADRLQQVFENLFRNAVEHGGDDVAVSVGLLDGGEGFFVADDGPGVPEAERGEVFERGYTTSEDGTGFGLAIVAEIVDAHGWDVSLAESEGGGARFEIRDVGVVGRETK
ncbi:hybrid sensor histidine kinase/response regulator [Halobacterium litoreum]|uniref:histidine kinase n=1 Tax=Halobacterium litoreum TaxID=2039234 RepID=A0ABD5NHA9_9EURY|nr:response regulator [Halobacterium litoreum]UHH12513.1 response regulator [Halobacterium litoreum]